MPKKDLESFRKEIRVRRLTAEDYDEIAALQKKCFPGMEPWRRDDIRSHVEQFPDGQLCVEYEGRIIGSSSSLIIEFDEFSVEHSFSDVTGGGGIATHDPDGDTLYGIEVMVDPDYRGMKIGRRLYDERKELARRLNLKRIVVGGRVPNYHKHHETYTIREYVEQVMAKNVYDPVLTFQISNGFVLKRIPVSYTHLTLPTNREV